MLVRKGLSMRCRFGSRSPVLVMMGFPGMPKVQMGNDFNVETWATAILALVVVVGQFPWHINANQTANSKFSTCEGKLISFSATTF